MATAHGVKKEKLMTIANSAELVTPLVLGNKIPDSQLTSFSGDKRSLYEIINQKSSLIVFYRGGW